MPEDDVNVTPELVLETETHNLNTDILSELDVDPILDTTKVKKPKKRTNIEILKDILEKNNTVKTEASYGALYKQIKTAWKQLGKNRIYNNKTNIS